MEAKDRELLERSIHDVHSWFVAYAAANPVAPEVCLGVGILVGTAMRLLGAAEDDELARGGGEHAADEVPT